MTVFPSDALDGEAHSLYPIPVNSKDFQFGDDPLQPAPLAKMIEFADKMSRLYADHGGAETIFVALASYRDDDCVRTIMNAFETAMYPDRLRFGVFQQHNATDGDCGDFDKLVNCEHSAGAIHPLCGRFSLVWALQSRALLRGRGLCAADQHALTLRGALEQCARGHVGVRRQ